MLLRNLLLALGAVASLTGLVLLGLWLRQPTEAAKPVVATVEVLVAARPLAIGTLLGANDIAWKAISEDIVPAESIVRGGPGDTELLGALVQRAVASGQPLPQSALLRPSDRGFLSAVLRPNYRAVSIAVDAPQSASGLLRPGDHVDIILTQNFGDLSPNPGHRSVGETVLRDIRIVAVDQSLSPAATATALAPSGTNAEPRIPKTITLEVSELDAEKLLLAVQLGKVEAAVRPIEAEQAGTVQATTAPTWASDVSPALGTMAAAPKPATTAAAAPHAARGIIIMRGAKTEAH